MRTETSLDAIVSRQVQDGEQPRFILETRALQAVPAGVCPRAGHVQQAWTALGEARRFDATTLAHATVVLLETVEQPTRKARMAAAGCDLRRALTDRSTRAGLVAALAETASRTAPRLARLGYEPDRVEAALHTHDPALAYHHGRVAASHVPPLFAVHVLPALRGLAWSRVGQALAAFWASGLHRDEGLRAAIVRLLALAGGERGLAWWTFVLRLPPAERIDLLTALIHTGACATDPGTIAPSDIDALLAATGGDEGADRLWFFAAGLASKVPVRFFIPLLRLANAYAPEYRLQQERALLACDPAMVRTLPQDVEDLVDALAMHVYEPMQEDWGTGFVVWLWRCCALLPGLVALLRRPVFLAAPPATSFALLQLLIGRFYYELEPDLAGWAEVRRRFESLATELPSVPTSHQPKYLTLVERIHAAWCAPLERAARLPLALAVARRLCKEPFHLDACAAACLVPLVEAAAGKPERLLRASDASFRRLEDACRFDNRRGLVEAGLVALASRLPGLMSESFVRHPEALFRAAAIVGSVSPPRADALLKRFRSHPVMQRRFARRPLAEICALLDAWRPPGQTSPIPRKLRLHLETHAPASAASLEGHRQTIARRLPVVRLELLRQAVLHGLAQGLPRGLPQDDRGRHALMLLGSIATNRRLLRRLLRAYANGDRGYVENHIASREWFRRHPRVDRELWRIAIPCEREVTGEGRVCISIEQDPLEALKLGTHVGSCLSVGGAFDYSAVSVVADVNKQVAYARRSDRAIVGRQVVAITEDDRLAFLPVYPLSASEGIRQAFLDFDLAFAKALGLTPFVGDEYEIALILARDWYDDGLWDRITPELLADTAK